MSNVASKVYLIGSCFPVSLFIPFIEQVNSLLKFTHISFPVVSSSLEFKGLNLQKTLTFVPDSYTYVGCFKNETG
jgi:hypothetical protein